MRVVHRYTYIVNNVINREKKYTLSYRKVNIRNYKKNLNKFREKR